MDGNFTEEFSCCVGKVQGAVADLETVDAKARGEIVGGEQGISKNNTATASKGVDCPDDTFDRVGREDGIAVKGGQAIKKSCIRKSGNLSDSWGTVVWGE